MTDRLRNLRDAYQQLCQDVDRALLTQLGDSRLLGLQRQEVFRFAQAAEQHHDVFDQEEMNTLRTSVESMLAALDSARHQSSDPPDLPPLVVSSPVLTGRRGRPRIEIDSVFLQHALELRGPTHIGKVIGVGSRTVRRRALEQGLVQPGLPVCTHSTQDDGTVVRHYSSSSRPVSTMTDAELDQKVSEILEVFPNFGRKMIDGHLRSKGHHVPRQRLVDSYNRVHGAPGSFGRRRIERKTYQVAGANALWHHDGQHGLIRWKIVIHTFIDGATRLVPATGAHNNNRALTVLALFHRGREQYGTPSRVRGDHGTENVEVAKWMEENRGPGRGSYIWGKSVHNTRIERLWVDVTQGFGSKWKKFFYELEANEGLNPTIPAHIWLLHHLFLSCVDQDCQEWADAWNSHQMTIRGQRQRSPRDMFMFSMLQDGPRGMEIVPDPDNEQLQPDDIATYGIDWEVLDNPTLMNHFLTNNPQDAAENANPFDVGPTNLSNVPCEPPNCPLSEEEIRLLDWELSQQVDLTSRNMYIRRLVWQKALDICNRIVTQRS